VIAATRATYALADPATRTKQEQVLAVNNSIVRYDVSFRAGGGLAIAALARASRLPVHGDFDQATYSQTAEAAFAFLEQHNRQLTSDGRENILDDYNELVVDLATLVHSIDRGARCRVGDPRVERVGGHHGVVAQAILRQQVKVGVVAEAAAGPALDRFPSVTALTLDAQERLWVGTAHHGVFLRADTSWRPTLAAAPVYALATTADGTVWVGTGIGLFRQTPDGWLVYSEEGTANHGLPDNIVERLVALPEGLWVIMSEAVSFFPIDAADHPVEFAYLGHPGNRIHDVVDLPESGYLLATDDGLVWLRELPHFKAHGGFRELRVMEYDLARPLSPASLDLPDEPITRLDRQGNWLYLAGPSGLFRRPLTRLFPARLVTR